MAQKTPLMTFLSNTPIGTILPFAGDVTDATVSALLNEEGWLPCIGLSFNKKDYRDLFAVIGYRFGGGGDFFNLPDARGLFIRGAQAPEDKGPGAVLGAVQESSTALPITPFVIQEAGEHDHTLVNLPTGNHQTYYTAGHETAQWTDTNTTTNPAGAHFHTVNMGGDKETRPLNVYLDYIIKYKESAS